MYSELFYAGDSFWSGQRNNIKIILWARALMNISFQAHKLGNFRSLAESKNRF